MAQQFFVWMEQYDIDTLGGMYGQTEVVDGNKGIIVTHDKVDDVLSKLHKAVDICEQTSIPGLFRLKLATRGRGRPKKFSPEKRNTPTPGAPIPPPIPRDEISRTKYIEVCSQTLTMKKRDSEAKLQRYTREADDYQARLVSMLREIQKLEVEVQAYSELPAGETERYGQEYDSLRSSPKIRRINIKDGTLHVYTKTLFCKDPRSGLTHEIGEFDIQINTTNGNIIWKNQTRKVDAYWSQAHAPHVDDRGVACMGSLRDILPALVARYEFAAMVSMAIQFIENVNVNDSAGRYIDRWPVATEGQGS